MIEGNQHPWSTKLISSHAGLLALAACVFLAVRYFLCAVEYRRETNFGVDHGCLPVEARAPYWLPLSLDMVYKGFKANSQQRLLALFTEYYDALGPNIEQTLVGATGFVTMDPENVEAILSSRFEDFGFGPRRNAFWALLGDGIFTQEALPWKHSRELLRRQFIRMQYQNLEVFNEYVDNLIHTIRESPDILDLQPIFFRYTLDTTTALIFGKSVNSLLADGRDSFSESFSYAANVSAMRLRLGDLYWLHTPRRFVKACKEVKRYADEYITRALDTSQVEHKEPTNDLAFIQDLYDELREESSVRDQLINVLLAGRDTTACLMTWAMRLILRHPQVHRRLQEEIRSVTGDTQHYTRPQIRKMAYLEHVLNETLRLYPSVPINLRFASKPTLLPRGGGPGGSGPVLIRRGMGVTYSVYHMHRRKDLWGADALEFKPERWEDPQLTSAPWLRWGYLPFNGGPRICLGKDLALMEASYGLARIIQEFPTLKLPPDTTFEAPGTERQALTLVLASGDGCKVQK